MSTDINIQDWSISALTDCLLDNSDESSSVTNNILIGERSDGISLDINGPTRLNPTIPSSVQVQGFVSRKNEIIPPSTRVSNDTSQVEMKPNRIEEDIWTYSPWSNNLRVFGETSKGIFSSKDIAEQQFGGPDTNYEDCKNVNSFFSFPHDSELDKALGPFAKRQIAAYESKCFSGEDTYSSSTLISNIKEHDHIKDLQFSECDAEYLLDAVIGNLCSASDDTSSTIPTVFPASIHPKNHSEESILMMANADSNSHLTSAFVANDIEDSTILFTFASLDGNSNALFDGTQHEAVHSNVQPKSGLKISSTGKRKARVGNTQRPRPRDRQLIMDRMKELRELVPDGAKVC